MERRTLLSADDLTLAVNRISLQILERNHNIEKLAIVGIHTCGVFLARHIRKFIQEQTGQELPHGSLDINLYRDDWSLISQNPVVRTTDIGFTVEERDVILVDDVLFTGRTIRAALEALMDYGRPHSVQLAVLVDRGGRELPIQADYVGVHTTVMADERIKVIMKEHGGRDEVVLESLN
jgi:pyrimidine operon attenuation protein / uracil phosphoribosyltransferase